MGQIDPLLRRWLFAGRVHPHIPAGGYVALLCPDQVPFFEIDPECERFFAFCLGYTKAPLQIA